MELSCDDRDLTKLLADPSRAARKLGTVGARRLAARVADLRAVGCMADVQKLPGRLHSLVADRAGEYSLDLHHPYRLLFVPDHDPLPELPGGGLDWAAVTRVRLIGIVDTHR